MKPICSEQPLATKKRLFCSHFVATEKAKPRKVPLLRHFSRHKEQNLFRGKVTVPEKGKITVPGCCPFFDPISSHALPLSPGPSPPPRGIQGLLRGRYDHGADHGEIPKTEHCRAASCADFVATFPRPFRGSSTPPFHREIAAISGFLSDSVSYWNVPESGHWSEHRYRIRSHFRGVSKQNWEMIWDV